MSNGQTAELAAVLNGRRGLMAEVIPDYLWVARQRLKSAESGDIRTRPRTRPVYDPS